MQRTCSWLLGSIVIATLALAPIGSRSAAASCRTASSPTDTRAAARPVAASNDYATIELAAKAAGAPLGPNGVVLVMVLPAFVDVRIAASPRACAVYGTATRPDPALRWSPPLPTTWSGARFVTSTTRSITVELKTSTGWHRFRAVTPTRLHWIAGS